MRNYFGDTAILLFSFSGSLFGYIVFVSIFEQRELYSSLTPDITGLFHEFHSRLLVYCFRE